MGNDKAKKILLIDELVEKVRQHQSAGKSVVQSHGVYDLIHPGIIQHLKEAKQQADILIVTIIKDKDVRRGPGRPVFPGELRVENVASLEIVDYVCLVDDSMPFECVKIIRPNVFSKGQSNRERDHKIHDKIFEEERDIYFAQSKIIETKGCSFSSSKIINDFLDIYPDETKAFLKKFSSKYKFKDILKTVGDISSLKVLIVGDGIIDEYHYCSSMGKSAKNHLIVNKYISHEVFAGGAFIIANHIASICKDVTLVSLLGRDDNGANDFINKYLKTSVKPKFFYRDDGPSIVKKRYINQYLNQKLFEINYLNDSYINDECEAEVLRYIEDNVGNYDLVMVSDFGHGFITEGIIRAVENKAKVLAINVQTNGANTGYNLVTKYNSPDFVCLDEPELRLAAQEKFANIEDVLVKMQETINSSCLITTLGRKGSIGINKDNIINRTPIFSSKVVDTVGAGDAFFAYTAPCFFMGMPLDMVSFVGSAVGALAVQIVCNKKAVEKYEFLEFIHTILN